MKTARKRQQSPTPQKATAEPLSLYSLNKSSNGLLVRLMQTLQGVRIDTPEAKANETSMSDNNGKRIIYTLTKDMLKKLKR